MCSVDGFSSGIILGFLTLLQLFSVYISAIKSSLRFDVPYGTCSVDCGINWVVLSLLYMVSLLVFVAEAVALPFGTKRDTVAFVLLDAVGLHWTLLVSMICIGLMLVLYSQFPWCCKYEIGFSEGWFQFLSAICMFFCAMHACVTLGLHISEHWDFIPIFILFGLEARFFVASHSTNCIFGVLCLGFCGHTLVLSETKAF